MSELDKIEKYLVANADSQGITYERIDDDDNLNDWLAFPRHQIVVYKGNDRLWDVICQRGSYGHDAGLLEGYGKAVVREEDGDSVCGYMTAKDIVKRWEEYLKWQENT